MDKQEPRWTLLCEAFPGLGPSPTNFTAPCYSPARHCPPLLGHSALDSPVPGSAGGQETGKQHPLPHLPAAQSLTPTWQVFVVFISLGG